MGDILMIAITLTFFLAAIAYTGGCDHLKENRAGEKK